MLTTVSIPVYDRRESAVSIVSFDKHCNMRGKIEMLTLHFFHYKQIVNNCCYDLDFDMKVLSES